MSIHDNLIYKAFIDFLEEDRGPFRLSFYTDSVGPRFLKFSAPDFETIETVNIDLSHNEFLKQTRQFKDWYYRMRKVEMDDK